MKIQPVTKEYVIDLQQPEEERWGEVIRKERTVAKTLAGHAAASVLGYDATEASPPAWLRLALKTFDSAYRFSGGLYQGELESWAEAMGCSAREPTLLNCQYELAQLAERVGPNLPAWLPRLLRLGCTSGAVALGKGRVVHVRNMDWPLRQMGKATRIFRFVEGGREFVTVGVPGMVGALSGMVPGEYSATINYAPPTSVPGFDFGPLFLLRRVFETCDTYEEACHALSHTRLSANVLFMVCSAKGKARVIERTRKDFATLPMRGGTLSLANHYRSGKFSKENGKWCPEIVGHSDCRACTLKEGLKGLGPRASLEQVAAALDQESVLNAETCQMMAFDPSRGETLVWAVH